MCLQTLQAVQKFHSYIVDEVGHPSSYSSSHQTINNNKELPKSTLTLSYADDQINPLLSILHIPNNINMSRLSVTEPHPSAPKAGYISAGIGGAGNFKRYKPEEVSKGPDATGPASRVPLSKPTKRVVLSGRGGAGNFHSSRHEESIFQFDEEMVRKRDVSAPVYHVGRGGSGNIFASQKKPSSSRKSSTDSSGSESDRLSLSALRQNSGGVLSLFGRRSS